MRSWAVDSLAVEVYPSRREAGRRVAALAADEIARAVAARGRAVALLASAPSQEEVLEELRSLPGVDWPRVTGLHVDEYAGAGSEDSHSFRAFLTERLLNHVPIGEFHGIRGEEEDWESECRRYSRLLEQNPPDVAVLGIGENGHLAFNDPPVADFDDPQMVKRVELDNVCREQQVRDGMFSRIEDVPRYALTVTLPPILRVPRLLVTVPGATKQRAVKATLEDPISTACPSTALRRHSGALLALDEEAAALVKPRATNQS